MKKIKNDKENLVHVYRINKTQQKKKIPNGYEFFFGKYYNSQLIRKS